MIRFRLRDRLTPKQRLLAVLIIIQIVMACKMYGQSIGIYQDPKLAIVGDKERGINTGVVAVTLLFRMEGNDQSYGRMYLGPFVNFTNLKQNYWRYGVEGGYIWHSSINVELITGVQLGAINRFKGTYLSVGGVVGVWYDLGRVRAGVINTWIDRSDLRARWNDGGIRFNLEIGIEVKL